MKVIDETLYMSEQDFYEVKMEFEQNLKNKCILYKDGWTCAILGWKTSKIEKEEKAGGFFSNKTEKKTYYKIERIEFLDGRDGGEKYWSNGKGLMCTEMGVGNLLDARNRYVNMKKNLRNIGANIVKLPKRKKSE